MTPKIISVTPFPFRDPCPHCPIVDVLEPPRYGVQLRQSSLWYGHDIRSQCGATYDRAYRCPRVISVCAFRLKAQQCTITNLTKKRHHPTAVPHSVGLLDKIGVGLQLSLYWISTAVFTAMFIFDLYAVFSLNSTKAVSSQGSSQGCRRVRRFARSACHALTWLVGRRSTAV